MTAVMTEAEYVSHDATALAGLVRRGEVSAAELVELAAARIAALNPRLNAVIHSMVDQARQRAAAVDLNAPLCGVPFLMKDFCAEIAGQPFTEGSAFLRDFIPDRDSELYRRYCTAGLITLGKTNLPEFAFGATTEPRLFGPCRNPWDPSRTAGGSSGGAAAAVAARLVPLAHGNDVGGSIRIPAACCGLVGLKPSRGRGTTAPLYGDLAAGFFVEHVLSVSVRDSAAVLDATGAPAPGDPYHAPPPAEPFLTAVGRDPGRLRVGFSQQTPLGEPIHPDCTAAVQDAARLLESLGHRVESAEPRYDAERLWQSFTRLLSATAAWVLADWGRRTGREPSEEAIEPFVWAFAAAGRRLNAADYLLALQDAQAESRAWCEYLTDRDLFLTATLGQPPVELGELSYRGDPIELRRRTAAFSPYCYVSNATGLPALSLPLCCNAEGLPVGVQLVAGYGREDTLFSVAAQLEQAQPWAERLPPLARPAQRP